MVQSTSATWYREAFGCDAENAGHEERSEMQETYSGMTGENGVRMLQAGRNLARMVVIWKSCTFNVPIALRQDWR